MPRLRVAAVASTSVPDQKAATLAGIERWAEKAAHAGADLTCFPATALTGYWQSSEVADQAEILKVDTDNPALIHPAGPSVQKLDKLARRLKHYLAVGLVEDIDYYHLRRSVGLFGPRGHMGTAAQVHTPVERHPTYVGARAYPVFDVCGISMGIIVDEDLDYPEVARALVLAGARLLLASMSTPIEKGTVGIRRRQEQFRLLLGARAIENGVPVIGVEPAGEEHNTREKTRTRFAGQAIAFSADGSVAGATSGSNDEKMLQVDVNVPAAEPESLSRRRPYLYLPLTQERPPKEIPGTRERDWDAQGELLWSRLRDLGFFQVDLYARAQKTWTRRHEAVVVTARTLPPLRGYRAVVLTRPCLTRAKSRDLQKLSRWVSAGGTLVLDGYCGKNAGILGSLTGIQGPLRREVHLPSYEDASRRTVRFQFSSKDPVFLGMDATCCPKIWGQVWFPGKDTRVRAQHLGYVYSDDGEKLGSGLYRHGVGKGRVYALAFSCAYSQLLLMQGRGSVRDLGSFPERVAPQVPNDGDVNMWGDQVVTDAEDQYFPSADYHVIPFLNILRSALSEHTLVSPVPQGRELGVIFTGDSDRADADLVNAYTEQLAAHDIRPTQFICREGYDARTFNPKCEYGIHPLFHETEQDSLDVLVSYGFDASQLICGRRHCLIQYGLTETLERMAACGIRYTSNNWDFPYSETNSTAFLFGTTIPHHVYNWQGRRIGVVDIPQVFMDYPPLMECTRASYRDTKRTHGIGAWNFHPQNRVMPEQIEATEWLARKAREDRAWCGTMGEYGDWYLARDRLHVANVGNKVVVQGEMPPGLTLLSRRRYLNVNGQARKGHRVSYWHGKKYWVHVLESTHVNRR